MAECHFDVCLIECVDREGNLIGEAAFKVSDVVLVEPFLVRGPNGKHGSIVYLDAPSAAGGCLSVFTRLSVREMSDQIWPHAAPSNRARGR